MRKKFTSLIIFCCIVIFCLGCSINAQARSNINTMKNGAYVIGSYLSQTSDGRIMRVDSGTASDNSVFADYKCLLVEYYDRDYKLLESRTVPPELTTFGGFYSDGSAYYVLSGQDNEDEVDSKEVIRITKYDTDWNRISSCSLYGANTAAPFLSGSPKMTKSGKWLLIHLSHVIYEDSAGVNHQTNMSILVDTDTMTVADSQNGGWGFVSHSFDQYVIADGDEAVCLDLGDGNPRAVVLNKSRLPFTSGKIGRISGKSVNLINIPGESGNNYTAVTTGGFEQSSTSYIAVGNSAKLTPEIFNKGYHSFDEKVQRNIWVSSISKDLSGTPDTHYITDYSDGHDKPICTRLVKVGADSFVLFWAEGDDTIKAVKLDGYGHQVGKIYESTGKISDCQPVIINGEIVWYVMYGDSVILYRMDPKNPGNIVAVPHLFYKTPSIEYDKSYTGEIDDRSEGDYYKFTVKKTGKCSIDIESDDALDLKVVLYDENGNEIVSDNVWSEYEGDTWTVGDPTGHLSYKKTHELSPGTYYLAVLEYIDGYGHYTFHVGYREKGVTDQITSSQVSGLRLRKKGSRTIEASVNPVNIEGVKYNYAIKTGNKAWKIYKSDKALYTFRKLKKKSTWKVRVRAYTKIDGKKHYSKWSKAASMTL